MEMEVVVDVQPHTLTVPHYSSEFNFDSPASSSSPFITAPSSPQRFGNLYFSAPASPTKASAFLHHHLRTSRRSVSSIPFDWEEKPGVPKRRQADGNDDNDDDDFEFEFSGQLDRASVSASADELFDGGKIRPLKPPPRLQATSSVDADSAANSADLSPRFSSRLSQGKRIVQDALSPRHKKHSFDPFTAAIEETRKKEMNSNRYNHRQPDNEEPKRRQGRSSSSSRSFIRRGTRSLSPLRVSDIVQDQETAEEAAKAPSTTNTATSSSLNFSSWLSSISFSKGYRKWSLKDFLLFRSASEGRGTQKDPLRKYTTLSKRMSAANYADDLKCSSFRSTESGGSVSSRRRSSGASISAHEIHYTMNRAVSEEMKRKTFLPYKQGLLGCLGFGPPAMHEQLARVFGR